MPRTESEHQASSTTPEEQTEGQSSLFGQTSLNHEQGDASGPTTDANEQGGREGDDGSSETSSSQLSSQVEDTPGGAKPRDGLEQGGRTLGLQERRGLGTIQLWCSVLSQEETAQRRERAAESHLATEPGE